MGVEYWKPLIDFVRGSLLMNAAINPQDLEHLLVTDSPAEAVDFIKKAGTESFGLRYVSRRPRKLLFERGV